VHPLAVQAMAELGIDITGQRSKSVEEFRNGGFDLVITVCDGAAEACPLWLGKGRGIHAGLPDPAAVTGSETELMRAFRHVRDRIRKEVLPLLRSE
jgi:arsenate reductase